MRLAAVSGWLASALLLAHSRSASAGDEKPISRTGAYSVFETTTLSAAAKSVGREVDSEPAGKRIEGIDIVPIDVFDDNDGFLQFFNVFHVKSKKFVVERELLLHVGETYEPVIADELARNLRRLSNFSLVIVAAVKGDAPDSVRLLVVTRDIWSLRLNITTFQATSSGGLEQFSASPGEQNFLGAHQQIRANVSILPSTMVLGAEYANPRAFSTWIGVGAAAALQFNTRTGELEGSSGAASAGQPLYTTRTRWAWASSVAWSDVVVRRFAKGDVALFDAKSTPDPDRLPDAYRSNAYRYSMAVTRSYGWKQKANVTFGGEVNLREARLEGVETFDPRALAEFSRVRLPVGERRIGPFVQVRSYANDFMRILDHETIGLQEDVRLGQDVSLRAYPVLRAFGSSRDFAGFLASAQYTFPVGKDGLLRAYAENLVETNFETVSDAYFNPDLRFTSPRTGIGRLVVDGGFVHRYANSRNRYSAAGSRLRGYPTGTFIGRDAFYATAEFRTRPVRILSLLLGAAAFYDAADTPDDLFRNPRLHHDAGLGLRMLFPQLDRQVYRLDFGFPLERPLPAGVLPWAVSFAFGQAFDFDSASTSSTGYLGQ